MPKISNATDLKYAIQQLEHKRDEDLLSLKKQLHITTESFKLSNIIKGKLQRVISSPGLTATVVNAGIGLTTGFLTRKLFAGRSTLNPFKKLMSKFVEKSILKNGTGIKILSSLLSGITGHKK